MKKKVTKPTKATKTKKVVKKKALLTSSSTVPTLPDAPFGYEAYDSPVVDIELEFTDEQMTYIEAATKAGGYVSKGEFIRHALREALKTLT